MAKEAKTTKKSTPKTKKVATATKAKAVKFSFQSIGAMPEELTVPVGTTVSEFLAGRNIPAGYITALNGSEVDGTSVLDTGDFLRLGVKTKNA